ncbi:MAG TPA: hypothetical protein PLX03_08570 [Candidatus Hydrogenedentes bacterium]|nr:hypothetical protein [Candidatus Hydrogenedentota bacterium]
MGHKPLAVVAPQFDRFLPAPQRNAYLETVSAIATANGTRLVIRQPHAYNHFDQTAQETLLDALREAIDR